MITRTFLEQPSERLSSLLNRLIFVVPLALLLLLGVRAEAQQHTSVPGGTYLQTCTLATRSGVTLFATCQDSSNGRMRSSIDVTACEGDIWNSDGHLGCYARRGTWGKGGAAPRGSYRESCDRPWVKGTTLITSCRNRDGISDLTTLDLQGCSMRSNIANVGGHLACIDR